MNTTAMQDIEDFAEWAMSITDEPGYIAMEADEKAVRDLEAWEAKLNDAERLASLEEEDF